MKSRPFSRLRLETLEDRSVPAVTASVTNGSLIIKGDSAAASQLTITASDTNSDGVADTFQVVDGSTTVGTFSNVTRDVILRLSDNDDTVAIDLGGLSTPRGIQANLGDGANTLTIDNGTVKGSLSVLGGADTDTVTLGGTAALTVNGSAAFDLGDAADDVLHLADATVNGNLAAYFANTVTLDAASTVGRSVYILGGTGGNTVTVDGSVQGNVIFASAFGTTAGNTFTLTGTVDGNVAFYGSNQADTVNVSGSVGGSLLAFLAGGDDTADISGTVTNSLSLDGGTGNDTMTLGGTVGERTFVNGGAGDDKLSITSSADLMGRATVNLGAGADAITLDDGAGITTLLINGGTGSDTFNGTKTRNGLTLVSFELP